MDIRIKKFYRKFFFKILKFLNKILRKYWEIFGMVWVNYRGSIIKFWGNLFIKKHLGKFQKNYQIFKKFEINCT